MEYRTLNDLIADLVAFPGELFIRDRGCEALVYVPELNEILLLSDKNFEDVDTLCLCGDCVEEHFKQLIEKIKAEHLS